MARVYDVAEFILHEHGPMSAMKLQKLVYYSQAWSLVWDERPLFPEPIQAWSNGPVSPDLYAKHRGLFTVHPGSVGGDHKVLKEEEAETVQAVLRYYGGMSAQALSDLTHAEEPWNRARPGLPPGASSSAEITHEMLAEYYGSLPADL